MLKPISAITLDDLDKLIREPAYRNSSHPDHADLIEAVTNGFDKLFND